MTHNEQNTVIAAMQLAITVYAADAVNMELPIRLREQFARQAKDARDVLALIENGVYNLGAA